MRPLLYRQDKMIYDNITEGVFSARPNRFIAEVEISGETTVCHVKNTGRCRELLIPGAKVYLNRSNNPRRATRYDLVAVYKDERLVNIDSQAPNKAFLEYLKAGQYLSGLSLIKPEAKFGTSRFDFYVEAERRRIYIEVKGVTLEEEGAALFPDAPTLRGVRHLRELRDCLGLGYEAHVVFVIQMGGAKYFTPNDNTHPEFGETLRDAAEAGVRVSALDCRVTPAGMEIDGDVPVKLGDIC